MKKTGNNHLTKIIFSILLLLFSANLYAIEADEMDSNTVNMAIDVSLSLAINNYYPLTHFKEGNMDFTLNPVYFEPLKADSEDTDDMNGWALGLTFNYALSDSWSLYASFIGLSLEGRSFYWSGVGTESFNSDIFIYTLQTAIGCELLNLFGGGEKWSLPVMAGFYKSNFDLDIQPSVSDPSYDWHASGSNGYYGYFLGITFSRIIELFGQTFSFSPYIICYSEANEDAIVDSNVNGTGYKLVVEDDEYTGFYPGLNFSYITTEALSFSISISGWISNSLNFYNNLFLDELEMRQYSLSITYSID